MHFGFYWNNNLKYCLLRLELPSEARSLGTFLTVILHNGLMNWVFSIISLNFYFPFLFRLLFLFSILNSLKDSISIFLYVQENKTKNKELVPRNDLVSVDDAFRLYFYDSWTKFESSGQCHSNEEVAACTLARHSHSDQNC